MLLPIFYALLLVSTLLSRPAQAQFTFNVDSAESVYESGKKLKTSDQLALLEILSTHHAVPQEQLIFSESLIELAESVDSVGLMYTGYLNKGTALMLTSDLPESLESYLEAARIAEKHNIPHIRRLHIAIADVYSIQGDHKNAIEFYKKAVNSTIAAGDSIGYASALLNLGDEYLNVDKADSALQYFTIANKIFTEQAHPEGVPVSLGNIGVAHYQLGNQDTAVAYISKALEKLEVIGDYYLISIFDGYMSDIALAQGDIDRAETYALKSLDMAMKYGLKDQISDVNLKLSSFYDSQGDHLKAFEYYKAHILYRDSVNDISAVQEMANVRTDYEISRKQIEVDLLNEEKRYNRLTILATAITTVLLGFLAFGLYRRNLYVNRTQKIIEKEKDRSEHLLLNILPEETARELKEHGKVKARRFESVSILFADFIGFTKHAENLTPEQIVHSVDYYFSAFDVIVEQHGLEKIKTMGDAYMCAAGLHGNTDDHAEKITRAAMDIAEFVEHANTKNDISIANFEVRIGINSGPVVAGVVGTKKFAYDIWGDAVNIAARMESNSEPGRINVSENTYSMISHLIPCEYRGEINVKNKGRMKMYFVHTDSSQMEASQQKSSTTPRLD